MRQILITEKQFKNLKDTFRIGFGGVSGYGHVSENNELEVDSDEVDLSSFKPRETLTHSLWSSDGKLDSRIRLKLLDIADDFIRFLDLGDLEPIDIRLTGSICNYNWSEQSDIDMHIIMDFSQIDSKKNLVRGFMDAKKNEWNDMHEDLNIYGFTVELYVEDPSESAVSSGVYSLQKNEWIKEPSKNNIELNGIDTIKELSAAIMTMIDDYEEMFYIEKDDSHKVEEIGDDLEELRIFIKNMRKEQLAEDGEMAVGNIVYKVLRRSGYLDSLYDLQNAIYDKLNSIN